jgi:hypothetical protein
MKINPGKSKAVSFTKGRMRERIKCYFEGQLIPEANSRPCKLYLTKSMEGFSFCNAYTHKGKQ